jgi:hypothetical protein
MSAFSVVGVNEVSDESQLVSTLFRNVFASGGKDSAITPQAIGQWGKKMPLLRQYQLREIRPEWFKDA